jgi:hypothetical protein
VGHVGSGPARRVRRPRGAVVHRIHTHGCRVSGCGRWGPCGGDPTWPCGMAGWWREGLFDLLNFGLDGRLFWILQDLCVARALCRMLFAL